jgi:hypothetical protein
MKILIITLLVLTGLVFFPLPTVLCIAFASFVGGMVKVFG